MTRHTILLLCTILIFSQLAFHPTQSGSGNIQFQPEVNYRFGEYLEISGEIKPQLSLQEATLYLELSPSTKVVAPLTLDSAQKFTYAHDFEAYPLRPFGIVTFWLELTLINGQRITSEKSEFRYEDNRFPWKTRTDSPFILHWRQGDLEFAQSTFEVAFEGKQKILNLLPLSVPDKIDIYIYGTAGDMREALQISQVNWIGAHADPDLNLILISISEGPDQRLQMEGQIPHELMHLILFHTFPDGYNNLPSWLNEGLASYAELYPSPDYFILLQNAAEKDTFIPLGNLCKSFPQEPSQAYLAYAQSAGVVQYIFENYGKDKMMSLLEIYRQGLNCDAGLQTALGVNQDDLFRQWRSEKFGSAPVHRALGNFLPWALILLIALGVPVMISIRYLIRPTIIVKEEE